MKAKWLWPFFWWFFPVTVWGQEQTQQLITPAGGFLNTGEGSISWSMGELATLTLSRPDTSLALTQGFQQPFLLGDTEDPKEVDIIVPSLILGADDGNQELIIEGLFQYPDNELTILNRWGEVVFKAKPYSNAEPWDGSFMGRGGSKLPQGAYYYIFKTSLADKKPRKGVLYLIGK